MGCHRLGFKDNNNNKKKNNENLIRGDKIKEL